jgi:hypothetical protein
MGRAALTRVRERRDTVSRWATICEVAVERPVAPSLLRFQSSEEGWGRGAGRVGVQYAVPDSKGLGSEGFW